MGNTWQVILINSSLGCTALGCWFQGFTLDLSQAALSPWQPKFTAKQKGLYGRELMESDTVRLTTINFLKEAAAAKYFLPCSHPWGDAPCPSPPHPSFSLSPSSKPLPLHLPENSSVCPFLTKWKQWANRRTSSASVPHKHLFLSALRRRGLPSFAVCCCVVTKLCPTLCKPMDCSPARLLCPWDSPGDNMGVSCHFLLQGIFLTQGSNPHLLLDRRVLYHWAAGEAHQMAAQKSVFSERMNEVGSSLLLQWTVGFVYIYIVVLTVLDLRCGIQAL